MTRSGARATAAAPVRLPGASALGLAGLGALLVVTALAVAPALDGDYTFDEHAGVKGNRAIQPGSPAGAALAYRFTPDQARPLFFLSLWLDARMHGMAPRGFRLTNLVLHLVTGIAVFLLLGRAAVSCAPPVARAGIVEGAALAGTAVFLLHPLQSESIIYIWGRSGVLATLLALLALLAAPGRGEPRGSGADTPAEPPRWTAFVPAWTLLALALATKEEAMILPLVALVFWIAVERVPARRAVAGAAWLALPVAAFVALRIPILGAAGRQVYVRSVAENVLGQGVVHLKMMALTLWPVGLSIDQSVRVPQAAVGLAATTLCLALAAAALWGARAPHAPTLRAACAGIVIGAATTLLYWAVPLPDLMSERRAYLPLFGVALTITALVVQVMGSLRGPTPTAAAGGGRAAAVALLPALAIAALLAPPLRARARLWADPTQLWLEAQRVAPAAARPYINLGVIAAERGDLDGASAHFDQAVAREPRNPEALYNRGRLRFERGDMAGAETDLTASVLADPTVPRARINLAVVYMRTGRLSDAEAQLRDALAIDPGEPRALANLAEVLRAAGRRDDALPLYRQALASDPGYAHAAARLGVALEESGDRAGALAAYREYMKRGPSSEADAAAVRARIEALEIALAAPGSIR